MPHQPHNRLRLALGVALSGALLALVFWLYAEPGFVVMLADQIWACF
ncbi:hypothetical protein [Paracidovorax wautersii]|uniref:Uncharacterized protein n=1 Tax=Paracidovorax wautersii TaxID=1177982 RepID=A0A1I2EGF9_9BURK|nr:hypothetical protein [Paracidovorax wautersii]SFE91773.1 hypothetical protein SAMN04489711_10794 [Paracidovorax wautersii]